MTITGTISAILNQKSKDLFRVSPDATVFEAIQMMADRNIGALLVMEGDQLIGIVSERDYARKVALKGKSSKQALVREIISTPLIFATANHTIEDCMRFMTSHRVRHLPILEGQQVLGVVSIGDLVNWIISAQHETISQLESYITGQYPG